MKETAEEGNWLVLERNMVDQRMSRQKEPTLGRSNVAREGTGVSLH